MPRFGSSLPGALLALLFVTAFGCSNLSSSVSPSAATDASTSQVPAATAVGLQGIIRDLNVSRRSFSLVARGVSPRLVRADADTIIWDGRSGSRVRFAALQHGMRVGVRGIDQGRFVLASSIAIQP